MFQAENLLLIALGFAVATFLGLIIGRLCWKWALRLGAKRALHNVPSTVAELHSERDRLRAENSMLSTKVETRLADMKSRMAEQAAEVARHRNRLQTVVADLETAEGALTARTAEVTALQERVATLETESASLMKQLEDARAVQAERDRDAAEQLRLAGQEQVRLATPEQAVPVSPPSEKRRSPMPLGPALPPPQLMPDDAPLKRRIKDLTRMSEKMSRERKAAPSAEPPITSATILVKPADSQQMQTFHPAYAVEEHISAAEETSRQVQSELAKLDAVWSSVEESGTASGAPSGPAAETTTKRGITNVVSLANRIKALQQDIKD